MKVQNKYVRFALHEIGLVRHFLKIHRRFGLAFRLCLLMVLAALFLPYFEMLVHRIPNWYELKDAAWLGGLLLGIGSHFLEQIEL